jgi:AcrR family transcriptional regulator
MGGIAGELQISKGTIVHHFGSKDRMLEQMSSEYMDRRLAEIKSILQRDESASQQLRDVIRATLLAHMDDRAATVAFSREFTRFMEEPVMAGVRAKRSEFMDSLRQILRIGISDGEFRNVDPALISFQVMGMCNWCWTWLNPGGRVSVATVADTFADLVLAGLKMPAVIDRPYG